MARYNLESMRPQDVVILIKLILLEGQEWTQLSLADDLFMSQSEISESLSRSRYARLIKQKNYVDKQAFVDFIIHGIPYVYPQRPGGITRGIPTSHSAQPLNDDISSDDPYVWPYVKGQVRGRGVKPLYPSVVHAIDRDNRLYQILSLIDALRVGRAREKELAIKYLKGMLC